MKDIVGRELKVGDYVVTGSSYGASRANIARIVSIRKETRREYRWSVKDWVTEEVELPTVRHVATWGEPRISGYGHLQSSNVYKVSPASVPPNIKAILANAIKKQKKPSKKVATGILRKVQVESAEKKLVLA